jgi:hypothetical protein
MSLKHGLYQDPLTGKKSRLYHIWEDMKSRCNNVKNQRYKDYGGRGITVCDLWANDFKAFYDWAMANGYSDELTIDRENVNGIYEPGNCRWATQKEQSNNRTTNKMIEYNGETKTLMQWADDLGFEYHVLKNRLNRNWTVEKAFSTDTKKYSKQGALQ